MGSAVFVAGVGVISAIGRDVKACLFSLQAGEAGIGHMQYLDSEHKGILPVAEVKASNRQLASCTGFDEHISRTALLSMSAAAEALGDAAIPGLSGLRTGFISANTVGGMDKTEHFFEDYLRDSKKGRLREVIHHECGTITELVSERLGIRDFVTTISTACSSSANSIALGSRLIEQDILDLVVAGGTDALTRFTLNGFNTLMILDKALCKPFDQDRKGLNLGEGAGYLVLISERLAGSLGRHLYCQLSGHCNANDAYHQTASSPQGTGSLLAMKGALEKSRLQPQDISYINLHGTGTLNNDLAEGTAIRQLFEPAYPPMSSTKSFTGHTLGASGAIEAVFSVLAIREGIIYPNLRLEKPMKEFPFAVERNFKKDQSVEHVLSNSFGFGGNCTSLVFSTY